MGTGAGYTKNIFFTLRSDIKHVSIYYMTRVPFLLVHVGYCWGMRNRWGKMRGTMIGKRCAVALVGFSPFFRRLISSGAIK